MSYAWHFASAQHLGDHRPDTWDKLMASTYVSGRFSFLTQWRTDAFGGIPSALRPVLFSFCLSDFQSVTEARPGTGTHQPVGSSSESQWE